MNRSAIESGLVQALKESDLITEIPSDRILVSVRMNPEPGGSGSITADELTDGGIVVNYGDSSPQHTLAHGAPLARTTRFTVSVGARRDDDPERVFRIMDSVIETLNGLYLDGAVMRYDSDRFRRVFNGIWWYDVIFRTTTV